MYTACGLLLSDGLGEPGDWATHYGCQALVHWEGAAVEPPAARKASAHTIGLSQLTTARYMVFLSMLHPDHTHEAIPPPKAVDGRALAEDSGDPHGVTVDCAVGRAALLPRASEPAVARWLAKGGPVGLPAFDKKVRAICRLLFGRACVFAPGLLFAGLLRRAAWFDSLSARRFARCWPR